jgi:hypothetical protein
MLCLSSGLKFYISFQFIFCESNTMTPLPYLKFLVGPVNSALNWGNLEWRKFSTEITDLGSLKLDVKCGNTVNQGTLNGSCALCLLYSFHCTWNKLIKLVTWKDDDYFAFQYNAEHRRRSQVEPGHGFNWPSCCYHRSSCRWVWISFGRTRVSVHSPCFYEWLQEHQMWSVVSSIHSFYMASALCLFCSAFNKFELHLLVEAFHFCFITFIFPLIFFFVHNRTKWSQQLVQTEELTPITPSDMCALCVTTVFYWVFLCENFSCTVTICFFVFMWRIPHAAFILTNFRSRECSII